MLVEGQEEREGREVEEAEEEKKEKKEVTEESDEKEKVRGKINQFPPPIFYMYYIPNFFHL